eukprot:m.58505 g.58505  ORF g.58505 m.58505 type:complete len:519 (+) comp7826_c0_seq1:482-2038(+)
MSDASRVNIIKYHEDRAWGKPKKNLPVTLVTGPLGAGKTTTLRHILQNKRNLRVAAAVNDFAAVNVDSDLIASEKKDAGVMALTNGCICCSKKGDLVEKVWSVLKEADSGNVDYLVIETSGVTDPCTVVQALEAEYGKMFRIRLDSVVLVLDADEVVSRLDDGQPPVHPHQLACADVVLLNKCDLIEKNNVERAAAYLAATIPNVVVHQCSFGSAPLDAILEVREEASTISGGAVAHETVERKLHVSAFDDKTLRTSKLTDVSGDGGHIADEHVNSMVFESERPFSLGAFQDFLGPNFPGGIRRIKGWIYFAEDAVGQSWMFHYSGRRRYECSPDTTPSTAQRRVRIVLIGTNLDVAAIQGALSAACASVAPAAPSPHVGNQPHHAADLSVVLDDDRFEVRPVTDTDTDTDTFATASNISQVCFRMTACKPLEVTLSELVEKHGVDLNRVNTELHDRINYSPGAPFVTQVHDDEGTVWLRYACTGTQRLGDIWPAVAKAADKLMKDVFSHVYACKCGW